MAKPQGDPLYAHPTWRFAQRHWRKELSKRRLACARCGRPLRRGMPRGDDSLDVGHITPRHDAVLLGWTVEQINHLSNTQPECQSCNRTHGASYGNEVRGRALPEPVTSRHW